MSEKRQAPVLLLLLALAGGVVVHFFAWGAVGLGPWTALLAAWTTAVGAWLWRRGETVLPSWALWGLAPLAVGSLGLAVNESVGLESFNFFLIVLGSAVLGVGPTGAPWGLRAMAQGLMRAALAPICGFYAACQTDWRIGLPGMSPRQKGVVWGLVIAAPVLALVWGLLASADPAFGRLVSVRLNISMDEAVPRAFFILLLAFISYSAWSLVHPVAAGLLVLDSSARRKPVGAMPEGLPAVEGSFGDAHAGPPPVKASGPPASVDPAAVLTTVLAVLAGAFVLFLGVQARALIGGDQYVLATEGATYSAHARRGFFEILTVVSLVLPGMALGHAAVEGMGGRRGRGAGILSSVMSGLMILLLASAAHRMTLYVQAYGLSSQRFYAYAGMAFLGLVLCAAAFMSLRLRLSRIAGPALAALTAVGAVINIMPPDRVIASVNLSRAARTHPAGGVQTDWDVITGLGADAWPVIKAKAPRNIAEAWQAGFYGTDKGTLPSWSEMRALADPLPKTVQPARPQSLMDMVNSLMNMDF